MPRNIGEYRDDSLMPNVPLYGTPEDLIWSWVETPLTEWEEKDKYRS